MVGAKKSTAGSLNVWVWNEIKSLPLAWFFGLGAGYSPEYGGGCCFLASGVLDAYIAMIPKVDGDSTPLGQRTFCVLSVIDRLWASLSGLLTSRIGSWAGFLSGLKRGFSTALEVEEVLPGAWVINCMSWLLMLLTLLTPLTGFFLTVHLVALVCLPGSGRFTLHITIRSGLGLSCCPSCPLV